MDEKKLKANEKIKVNLSFDEVLDKMFENKKFTMREKLEKVFLYNGETIRQTNSEYAKTIFDRMITDALKDEQLLNDMFEEPDLKPTWNYALREGQGIVIEPKDLSPDAIKKIGKLLSDSHNLYNTPLS